MTKIRILDFKKNLAYIYFIIPFIFNAQNKISIIFSLLIGKDAFNLKLNNILVKIKRNDFYQLYSILGIIAYSTSYSINSKKVLEISFDEENRFSIPLDNLSYENSNLLELLFLGTKYGANFFSKDVKNIQLREKSFKIFTNNNKKIIETSDGIKFYIDSIHPGNTIIETFIKNIHMINTKIDWKNKIIVDAGAECGDTPLYFANKGAKVYAIEPVKTHFNFMQKNLELNQDLAKNIIPINAAIGENGILKFYESTKEGGGGGASYVDNNQEDDFKITEVQGYTLKMLKEKFGISRIDLLKMDCKGCEFFLTKEDLEHVENVKIEYTIMNDKNKLENLLKLLENIGFKCMLYRHSEQGRNSNKLEGNIYGTKIVNVK
jgi:FkbM family methyltransferase|tara:strand:- start:178 stop:1308 length:1131 start_codon:yes stop_codon:yes gene_type:complete